MAANPTDSSVDGREHRDIGFYFLCAILLNVIWIVILMNAWHASTVLIKSHYTFVAPYAFVAAIGLNWAKMLRRWQSALFFALVILANTLAVSFGVRWSGGDIVLMGVFAGLVGSLIPYLGLALIKRSWSVNVIVNISVFGVILALAGGGLFKNPMLTMDSRLLGKGFSDLKLMIFLYAPWQVLFSYGVLIICKGSEYNVLKRFISWWSS